jgi:biopolymer transport protein ExbD
MAVKINKGVSYSNINVTPMIDYLLFLLIFFLVTTTFEESEREMNVVLPEASEAMPLTARPKEVFVNVDRQGNIVVAGERLNEAQLLAVLRQAAANNPERQSVIIRADKHCMFESLMVVMNACNKAKIRDYRVTALEPKA